MKQPETKETQMMECLAEPTRYAGYKLCDPQGHRIGKVKEVFAGESGQPHYVRVGRGPLRASILIPVETVAVDTQHLTMTLQ